MQEQINTSTVISASDSQQSPFDRLRGVDLNGEFWTARDMQRALEYTEFRKFEPVVARAMSAIEGLGMSASDHIGRAGGMVSIGSGAQREVQDYRLTRFGAYMVAMNGDPAKPRVAEAQGYFAQQTRRQEIAPKLPHVPPTSVSRRELALAVLAAEEELERANGRIAELEPADAFRAAMDAAVGNCAISDLANQFRVYAQQVWPDLKVLNEDVFKHAGMAGITVRSFGIRHNSPTAQAVKAGWAKPSTTFHETYSHGTKMSTATHLTPKGQMRLWRHLFDYAHTNGSLTLPSPS